MYDNDPKLVWACPEKINSYIDTCRDDVILSLTRFDYKTTTPLLQAVWPTVDLGISDAGVPPLRGTGHRRVGKRKRRPQSDLDYKHGPAIGRVVRRKNLRKSQRGPSLDDASDSGSGIGKNFEVNDIILEAKDHRSGNVYVYVIWKDCPLTDASWQPFNNLLATVKSWWTVERATRFPGVNYDLIRPRQYIASKPWPQLIVSESSSEAANVPSADEKSSDSFDEKEQFECEIIKERTVRKQLQYRVVWKDYPKKQASWILPNQLNSDAIDAWNAKKKKH